MSEKKEEFKVKGADLVRKVKELIHQGNIRKIIIKDNNGKEYLTIPLTWSVVGVAIAPIIAPVAAIALLLTEFTIEVVKIDDKNKKNNMEKTNNEE